MTNDDNQIDRAAVAQGIFNQLARDLGPHWSRRLTQAERELVHAVVADAATMMLLSLAGDLERAARERAHVDAQLRNLTSAESARVARAFWASVATVLKTAVGIIAASVV